MTMDNGTAGGQAPVRRRSLPIRTGQDREPAPLVRPGTGEFGSLSNPRMVSRQELAERGKDIPVRGRQQPERSDPWGIAGMSHSELDAMSKGMLMGMQMRQSMPAAFGVQHLVDYRNMEDLVRGTVKELLYQSLSAKAAQAWQFPGLPEAKIDWRGQSEALPREELPAPYTGMDLGPRTRASVLAEPTDLQRFAFADRSDEQLREEALRLDNLHYPGKYAHLPKAERPRPYGVEARMPAVPPSAPKQWPASSMAEVMADPDRPSVDVSPSYAEIAKSMGEPDRVPAPPAQPEVPGIHPQAEEVWKQFPELRPASQAGAAGQAPGAVHPQAAEVWAQFPELRPQNAPAAPGAGEAGIER